MSTDDRIRVTRRGLIATIELNAPPYNRLGIALFDALEGAVDELAEDESVRAIVVMTDGRQNTDPSPQSVATDIVANHNVRIHTVTFTPQADQETMKDVALIGNLIRGGAN